MNGNKIYECKQNIKNRDIIQTVLVVIARKQCMKSFPVSMVETWVFLAQSSDHKLSHAKFRAYQQIKMKFGSIALAKLYIEQQKDQRIEVVVI